MSGAHAEPADSRPARRRGRRRILFLAALAVLLLASIVARRPLEERARVALERRLAAALGGPAHIGALRLRLATLEASFEDVELQVAGPEGEPLRIAVRSGRVRLGWSALPALAGRRLALAELELVEPVLDLERGFLRAPPGGRAARGPLDLRIDRLDVERGRLRFADRENRLDLHAENVETTAAWDDARRGLAGQARLDLHVRRPPIDEPLALSVEGRFLWRRHGIDLTALGVTGVGIAGEVEGTIGLLESATVVLHGTARVDLDALAPALDPEFPQIGGAVAGEFQIEAGPEPFELRARGAGNDLRFGRLATESAELAARITPQRIALHEISARAFGGTVDGEVEIRLEAPTRFRAAIHGVELASQALSAWLGLPLPLDCRLDGAVELSGEAERRATWNGTGDFVARAGPGVDGVAVDGQGRFAIEHGTLELNARSSIPGADLDVSVSAELSGDPKRGRLGLAGTIDDARPAQQASRRFLSGLGIDLGPLAQRPLAGHGPIEVGIPLGSPEPRVDVRATLHQAAWGELAFDEVSIDLGLAGGDLDLRELTLRRGAEALDASGRIGLDPFELHELELSARDLALAGLLELLGLELAVEGRGDLSASVRAGRGSGALTIRDMQAFGERIDRVEADVGLADGTLRLDSVRLAGAAVEADGRVVWRLDSGEVELQLTRGLLRLAQSQTLRAAGTELEGELLVRGAVSSAGAGPMGELSLEARDLAAGGLPIGAGSGVLRLDGGQARIDFVGSEPSWSLGGGVGLGQGLPLDLELRLEDAPFEVTDPAPASALLTARLGLLGSLEAPREIAVAGEILHARLELGFERLQLVEPARIAIDRDGMQLDPLHLVGGGTDARVALGYDFARATVAAKVDGTVDLGVLAAPATSVRGSGPVAVRLSVDGPLAEPRVEGLLEASDGRIRLLELHQGLDQIRFRIAVSGSELTLDEFSARSGNGEISATGRATLAERTVAGFDGQIQVVNFRLSYPQGFRGDFDARLRIRGDAEGATLSGRIDLLRGTYDRNLDLRSLLLSKSREFSGRESNPLEEWLALDVRLVADESVRVRNALARLEAGADLQVRGTVGHPTVTGRLAVTPGGQLVYRDERYSIVAANVDFLERERIVPYLSLQAETHVDEYTIRLHIEGTTDRFDYSLTSEPALDTAEIIALLTTGSTLGNRSSTSAGGDLAANYFAGILTQPVTRQLERWVGVDRIEINPVVAQDTGDPTTRITLSEEISEDVVIVFSTDIGHSERQVYRVNWFTTPKVRMTLENDTSSGLGGEIGYFTRFWPGGRPERPAAPRRDAPGAAADGRPAVGAIRVSGVSDKVAQELGQRVGIDVGEPYSRSAMFRGVENIRRYYVDRGRIEARVDASAQQRGSGFDLLYEVDPGPRVDVIYDGVSRRQARQLTARLKDLWTESVFPEELYADSADVIRRYFEERGHYAVDVTYDSDALDGGRRVRFTVDRGKAIRVDAVNIHGGESISEDRIRRQLLTEPGGLFSKSPVVPSVLYEDRLAVRQLFREEGFLQAEVDEPQVRLSASGDSAQVDLTIDEGPRFTLERVEVAEAAGISSARLIQEIDLPVGEPFAPSQLLIGETRLRTLFDKRGYPDMAVHGEIAVEGTAVVVTFHVEPGARMRVGQIRVRGNVRTREHIVTRELALKPGDHLSREQILASQQALYRLGIFSKVRVDYSPLPGGEAGEQLVEIIVEESPPWVTSVSGGYDTEAGVKVGFALADENFRGRDQIVGLQGRWSGLERRIQLSGSEPRFFGLKVPAVANVGWDEQDKPAFSYERATFGFRLDRRLSQYWGVYGRYGFQNVIVTDVEDPEELAEEKLEDVRLGDIGGAIIRDSRDSPFAATRGTYFGVVGRVFSKPLGSERSFFKPEITAYKIWPWPHRLAFASTARSGIAVPFGTGERAVVPISESFFLGGDATLRGFERDELGPGDAMFLLNEELRYPIWKMLRGVVFYDAGNVYEATADFDPFDLRHVLGLGLRLETPIGPFRVEYGRKLDREEGESRGELFIAIGTAF